MRVRELGAVVFIAVAAACGDGEDEDTVVRTAAAENSATAYGSGSEELSAEELEAGRLDAGWRQFADADARDRAAARQGGTADTTRSDPDTTRSDPDTTRSASNGSESWEDITAEAVNRAAADLPIRGDAAGPSVARLQILLDRARFSPGSIDGRWGKNTEKAVYWFQNENGLEPTGEADEATMQRLEEAATLDQPARTHTLTEDDVAGPFNQLPDDVYARAEQRCLCYQSLSEKLGEVFHTSPELLEQLNPGVDLESLSAGDQLDVPDVETFHTDDLPEGEHRGGEAVARIVISDGGHYLHAVDDSGDILYHFPSTLGADYAPSPTGEFSVRSITFDPTWHYQPGILSGVDPDEEDAVLPPGPNNAVGVVWMALSEEHYGIHGTAAPESIGYATSNGCVRLTNWDAARLGRMTPPDTPVEFRDVDGRE